MRWFFGKLKTLKSHSEINWPLAKKEKDSQHHSGFLWALFFLWKCRWQKSSLFPSVDLWFVRSWSRILQFLLGPNWPPWLALCKDVFGYGTYYCLWYGRNSRFWPFLPFSPNKLNNFAIFVIHLKWAIGQNSSSCLILRL